MTKVISPKEGDDGGVIVTPFSVFMQKLQGQSFPVILLVLVTWYFYTELESVRAEIKQCNAENKEILTNYAKNQEILLNVIKENTAAAKQTNETLALINDKMKKRW